MTEKTTRFNPFSTALNGTRFGKLYRDPDCRGHHARVFDSGERVSYFRRKVSGEDVKGALGVFDSAVPASREIPRGVDPVAYIGTRPTLNLKMARTLAAAVGTLVDRGVNPFRNVADARTAREGELTLAAAFDRYEADYLLPKGKRRAADLRGMFERYLGAIPEGVAKKKHGRKREKSPHGVDWSNKRLSQITERDARRLMNALKAGHSGYVANRVGELGRALYNRMAQWKDSDGRPYFKGENPFAKVEWFDEVSRERFVEADEAPAFFRSLNALPEGTFKDFVYVSLFTGARRANAMAMRWDAVDLIAATWTIPAQSSKSRKSMTLPLTAHAIELLRRRRKANSEGEFVFPAASKSGHITPPKKQWAALLESAGLADLRLHDLRRSLGSWAVSTGASLHVVGHALGHSSPEATKVYARLQVDPVRDAMQRAQDAMLKAAEVDPEKKPEPEPQRIAKVIPLKSAKK